MFYATPQQMKAVEAHSDKNGASYKTLMENAGAAAAAQICRLAADVDLSDGILILCGKGNNGGDGFVIARNLVAIGMNVSVVLASGDPATELAAYEYCELSESGKINVMNLNDNIDEVFRLFSASALIVDAVYGTGFHGELQPEIKACFSYASRCNAPIMAIDVPSGGNCLTGEVAENTLKCSYTITFGCKKIGMLSEPLKSLCGEIVVADIGLTEDCFHAVDYIAEDFDYTQAVKLLPERPENSYKNQFGHLLNISGSRRMSGAAALSTMAALRVGTGLVTLGSTDEVINRISAAFFEATLLPLSADANGLISSDNIDNIVGFSENMTALSVGCGLGVSEETAALVKGIISKVSCPIILDADGLNCITSCIDIIRSTKNKLIITPHLGELKRLYAAAYGSNEKSDRLTMAVSLAREYTHEYNIIVVAKGTPTYIAGDGRLLICRAGNPGLSKGGSGDVLTGVIAGLVSQGLEPVDAAAVGVAIHGKAADLAADKLSQEGMLPTDVINQLPFCV